MRWRSACVCVLWLVALLGCAETYRRGGRADRAAHKDVVDRIPIRVCSDDDYELYCADDEESEECLRNCGR